MLITDFSTEYLACQLDSLIGLDLELLKQTLKEPGYLWGQFRQLWVQPYRAIQLIGV